MGLVVTFISNFYERKNVPMISPPMWYHVSIRFELVGCLKKSLKYGSFLHIFNFSIIFSHFSGFSIWLCVSICANYTEKDRFHSSNYVCGTILEWQNTYRVSKKSIEFVSFWLKYLYFASSHLKHNVNQQSTDISTKKIQIIQIFLETL